MSTNAKKIETRSLTPKQRFNILTKFQQARSSGCSNQAAAEKVGVPYITLYTWLRDKLWQDDEHTKSPVRLAKRKAQRVNKAHKHRKVEKPAKVAETKGGKKRGRPRKLRNYAAKKPVAEVKPATPPAPMPAPIVEGKPIIVRLPNGASIEFPDLNEARDFALSLSQ